MSQRTSWCWGPDAFTGDEVQFFVTDEAPWTDADRTKFRHVWEQARTDPANVEFCIAALRLEELVRLFITDRLRDEASR